MYTLHSAAIRHNRSMITLPATKHNDWNAVLTDMHAVLELANFVPDNSDHAYTRLDFTVVKESETYPYVITYAKNIDNIWVKTYESKPTDMVNAARYNHPDCGGCTVCMKEA